MILCANCQHDGRETRACWQGGRIAVCDEHKAYHERLAQMKPIYRLFRQPRRHAPQFEPITG